MSHSILRKYLCVLAIVVPGLITGCTTTTTTIPGESAQAAQFRKVCQTLPFAKAAFDIARTQINVSAGVVRNIDLAYGLGISICRNPPEDLGQALVKLTEYLSIIVTTQKTVTRAVVISK